MKNIQVLKPYYRVEECLEVIRECLECGWTGLGFKTVEFEEAWKQYTRLPHAHMVNSATAGLHLAVKILKDAHGWEAGKSEVITSPLTFVSTNHAIMYEGLTPVFADIEEDSLCLDPESIEAMITPHTKAVIFVGVGGRMGKLTEVRALCKKHRLKLILDAAHMAGTRQWRRHVGDNCDVSVFSFQSVKNLPTADAGMICFNDTEFDARARKLSWLGIDKDTYARSNMEGTYKWKYDVPSLGYKYHGNSIMAAIGLVQLKYLEEDNKFRRKIAALYSEKLKHSEIHIYSDLPSTGARGSQHLVQVNISNRDKVIEEMNKRSIYPGVHYINNLEYSVYENCRSDKGCSRAQEASNRVMSLPVHLHMTEYDVELVVKNLREITGL